MQAGSQAIALADFDAYYASGDTLVTVQFATDPTPSVGGLTPHIEFHAPIGASRYGPQLVRAEERYEQTVGFLSEIPAATLRLRLKTDVGLWQGREPRSFLITGPTPIIPLCTTSPPSSPPMPPPSPPMPSPPPPGPPPSPSPEPPSPPMPPPSPLNPCIGESLSFDFSNAELAFSNLGFGSFSSAAAQGMRPRWRGCLLQAPTTTQQALARSTARPSTDISTSCASFWTRAVPLWMD